MMLEFAQLATAKSQLIAFVRLSKVKWDSM